MCQERDRYSANDGYYTLTFLASAAQRVIACEPGAAAEQLLRNAAANGHARGGRFEIERRSVGAHANEVSLRALLQGLPGPVLIKMDIDGGEVNALRTAIGMNLHNTFWVVETHSPDLERECISWFIYHGFKTSVIDHAWWRRIVPELRPGAQNRWLVAEPPGQE